MSPTIEIMCACCGEIGVHGGRELRHSCYMKHLHAGTLQQFPLLGTWVETRGRMEDFAELRRAGLSIRQAAERLGVTPRTGWRYETRLKPKAAA